MAKRKEITVKINEPPSFEEFQSQWNKDKERQLKIQKFVLYWFWFTTIWFLISLGILVNNLFDKIW